MDEALREAQRLAMGVHGWDAIEQVGTCRRGHTFTVDRSTDFLLPEERANDRLDFCRVCVSEWLRANFPATAKL